MWSCGMVIINSIVPVFALMILGHVLGRIGFMSDEIFRANDRLVYFIMFPVLLFWKVGGADPAATMDWRLIGTVVLLLFSAYGLSLLFVRVTRMPDFEVGAFSQCCYRFNTYVGLAVVFSVMGEGGLEQFSVLISIVIPVLNVMAVSTLIWYSGLNYTLKEKLRLFFRELIGNPLIIGCISGLVYAHTGLPMPTFFKNSFQLLTAATLPMALLSIGNALTLDKLKGFLYKAFFCSLIKNAYLPVAGYFILRSMGFTGIPLQAALIFLAMPTSVSAYILSAQLNSDPDMASACIFLSTVMSFFSLSGVVMVFH